LVGFLAHISSKQSGIEASLCGLVLGVFFLGCLFVYYTWENKRRDRQTGAVSERLDVHDLIEEQNNKTDKEIPSFRYTL
jgi:hypothetical protein